MAELKVKTKLTWLGLSSAANSLSDVEGEVSILENNLSGYDQFIEDIQDGINNYTDFENYLDSIGFTNDQAASFVEKIQQNFVDENDSGSTFDEFKTFVVEQTISFESLRTGFGQSNSITGEVTTEDGQPASGVKFHETEGVSRMGHTVPAGTTEIYGNEIHMSKTGPADVTPPAEEGDIDFTNISASNTTPEVGETVTVSCDVVSTKSTETDVIATFLEDGARIDAKNVRVPADSTESVQFDITKDEFVFNYYRIKTSEEIAVSWATALV